MVVQDENKPKWGTDVSYNTRLAQYNVMILSANVHDSG